MDLVFQVWIGTVLAIIAYLLGYTAFYFYATQRIYGFLKEKNPERYDYLKGNDLIGGGTEKRAMVQDRGRKWLNSDMDNEYEVIRSLKDGVNRYGRYGAYLFIYVLISSILIWAYTQGIF